MVVILIIIIIIGHGIISEHIKLVQIEWDINSVELLVEIMNLFSNNCHKSGLSIRVFIIVHYYFISWQCYQNKVGKRNSKLIKAELKQPFVADYEFCNMKKNYQVN